MSEGESGQAPQAPPQPAPAQQRSICPECQNPFIVKTPSLRFVNMPDVSFLVMGHGKPDRCPHCGATYVPTLQGFLEGGALNIQWKRVDAEQSPIVAPTQAQTQAVAQTRDAGGLIIP